MSYTSSISKMVLLFINYITRKEKTPSCHEPKDHNPVIIKPDNQMVSNHPNVPNGQLRMLENQRGI
jgi:hypothetical protein